MAKKSDRYWFANNSSISSNRKNSARIDKKKRNMLFLRQEKSLPKIRTLWFKLGIKIQKSHMNVYKQYLDYLKMYVHNPYK